MRPRDEICDIPTPPAFLAAKDPVMTKVRVWGAIAAWDLSKSMIEDKVELLPFHRRSGQHSCIGSP